MKLFGSTKNKNSEDENVPYLEITELVLVFYNTVIKYYQVNSRIISPKNFMVYWSKF